jgi:hypothetical protein
MILVLVDVTLIDFYCTICMGTSMQFLVIEAGQFRSFSVDVNDGNLGCLPPTLFNLNAYSSERT